MTAKRIKRCSAATIDRLIRLYTFITGWRPRPIVGPLAENTRVLIICLDNLGDAVMATPVIEALKSAYPRVSLTVLTRSQNSAVFANNPFVDEIIVDQAPWWSSRPVRDSLKPGYWIRWLETVARLRRAKYGAVIDLRGDLRHILLFGVAVSPGILLGYGKTGGECLLSAQITYDPQKHEIDKKLALLRPLGISGVRPRPKIWLTQEEIELARGFVRRHLGVHNSPVLLIDPGAKPIQQWPVERFANLARSLAARLGGPILVSAGPSFTPLVEQLIRTAGTDVVTSVGRTTVRALAALVSVCDLVISSDTGLAHIASAVGTQTVTLFGPTDPKRFWHGLKGGQIVQSPQAACTSELHVSCRKAKHSFPGPCMLSISEEMVEEAVRKALRDRSGRLAPPSRVGQRPCGE